MKIIKVLTIAILIFPVLVKSQPDTLFVYGPGGPAAAMEECAQTFSEKYSIPVKVTAGPEAK